jgi:multidrug efflux pump subunit AcrA (membrane-fusion protein)
MRLTSRKLLSSIALSLSIGTGSTFFAPHRAVAQQQPGTNTGVITAVTEPSKRSQMNFPAMGIIKEVKVKEGEVVKKGAPLMLQDTDVEQAELDRLKEEGESTARLDFAKADFDQKKAVYERKAKGDAGVFSANEIEEAKLDMVQRDKQIDVVTLDHKGDQIKAQQQQLKVNKMQLFAEFDGAIEAIKAWEGELATPEKDKPVIIVVKNDPAYVVIRELTTRQVARLSLGQSLEVKYPEEDKWQPAKIIYIAPVADATSDTQVVKLELPNPQNRATGLPVQVKLPQQLVSDGGADKTTASR